MSDKVIATLAASPPRRITGTAMLAILGGLLIYLALALQIGASQIILIVFGIGALLAAMRLHSATSQVIELTEHELRIQGGDVLAKVSNIEKVERGAFAFKPSNGFLVTLKSRGERRWSPGLYWSFSRKIGVGGVTGAPQTKGMAEALAILIAQRSAENSK
ncbi:MAG: hypothetical protein WBC85_11170 [Planktotalea sp.]|uniref:hypothetical protein n=1 Tax=Planktotalea sp. TaxID=2029877 RepID=UPI003C738A68